MTGVGPSGSFKAYLLLLTTSFRFAIISIDKDVKFEGVINQRY